MLFFFKDSLVTINGYSHRLTVNKFQFSNGNSFGYGDCCAVISMCGLFRRAVRHGQKIEQPLKEYRESQKGKVG